MKKRREEKKKKRRDVSEAEARSHTAFISILD